MTYFDLLGKCLENDTISNRIFMDVVRLCVDKEPIPYAPRVARAPKPKTPFVPIIPPVDACNGAQLYRLREIHAQLAAGIAKQR